MTIQGFENYQNRNYTTFFLKNNFFLDLLKNFFYESASR